MATLDLGNQIVAAADKAFKGLPYTWGNNDCSGIVQKIFAQFGIQLPRVSSQQWSSGMPVGMDQLQPGDLVFYNPGGAGAPPGLPGHVAIYAGNGQVFEALNPSTPIGYAPVYQDGLELMGARRIIGAVGGAVTGGAVSATPISSGSASATTVATGHGSTCAFALGTKNKILIWTVDFSICIISKTEVRALLGALLLAGGAVVTMAGVALVMQYALDKSDTMDAVAGRLPMIAGMLK
jgi:cell wall-associated NlpC family hydrolase